jgi:hypothetical protein
MLAHNKVQLAAMIHGRKIDALFMDADKMAGLDADGATLMALMVSVVCSMLMVSLCVLCVYF